MAYLTLLSALIIIFPYDPCPPSQIRQNIPSSTNQKQCYRTSSLTQNAYCKFNYNSNQIVTEVHYNCRGSADWTKEIVFNIQNLDGMIWLEVFHQQPPHDVLLGIGSITLRSLRLIPNETELCKY